MYVCFSFLLEEKWRDDACMVPDIIWELREGFSTHFVIKRREREELGH